MLPKNKRLNLKTEFKRVRLGKTINTPLLKLIIKKEGSGPTRIGVAITTSLFKKSHQRNKVKRVVFSAFENIYSQLPEGLSIIALPKQRVIDVKSDDLIKDLMDTLKRAKVLDE